MLFQVDIEDWFDTSNLADHTSMIVQAMMSDMFDSPSKAGEKWVNLTFTKHKVFWESLKFGILIPIEPSVSGIYLFC